MKPGPHTSRPIHWTRPSDSLPPVKKIRYAYVAGARDADEVSAYLPDNYNAIATYGDHILISGTDNAGWTLDGYVIPRLASGLMFATEFAQWSDLPDLLPNGGRR